MKQKIILQSSGQHELPTPRFRTELHRPPISSVANPIFQLAFEHTPPSTPTQKPGTPNAIHHLGVWIQQRIWRRLWQLEHSMPTALFCGKSGPTAAGRLLLLFHRVVLFWPQSTRMISWGESLDISKAELPPKAEEN